MGELTLKLVIDPVTGKRTVVADYHSDADALPHEHEDEHRRLVGDLLEGAPLDGGGGLLVDRPAEKAPHGVGDSATEEREAAEQKG